MPTKRMTEQELMDFALSQVPDTGEIPYRELHEKIRQSDNPEAVQMLPELKRRGLLKARVEVTPDGVQHAYTKVSPR